MRTLILFLFPLMLLANEPQWLTDLRIEKEAQPTTEQDIIVVSPSPDSKLGYWQVRTEYIPARRIEVPVRNANDPSDTDRTRIITRPGKKIYYWTWVEEDVKYQGNEKTQVVHKEGCRYWDCKHCIVFFHNVADAFDEGFEACGICKPEEDLE